MSPEPRTSWPRELVAQLAEVVELAVEDGDDVALLVCDRLAAGREVDHPQAPVPEHAPSERIDRPFVGPAVDERGVHPLDERCVRRCPTKRAVRRSRTSTAQPNERV